jgi:arsenate reductase
MAEALINNLGRDRYRAWSAGSFPAGYVQSKSIETLQRHGIDPGQPRSKSWNECAAQSFDLVITVCDQAAGETCPIFPGNPKKLHWSTPDPAKITGSDREIDAAFDRTFLRLKHRVEELIK